MHAVGTEAIVLDDEGVAVSNGDDVVVINVVCVPVVPVAVVSVAAVSVAVVSVADVSVAIDSAEVSVAVVSMVDAPVVVVSGADVSVTVGAVAEVSVAVVDVVGICVAVEVFVVEVTIALEQTTVGVLSHPQNWFKSTLTSASAHTLSGISDRAASTLAHMHSVSPSISTQICAAT